MARIKLLIDTDIFIDALKGVKPAKALFREEGADIFCSVLTKKELLSKEGLKQSERKSIENLMAKTKILKVDDSVQKRFHFLVNKYGDKPETRADFIIAATAMAKKLPLMTRNKKHYEHIEEITLTPIY